MACGSSALELRTEFYCEDCQKTFDMTKPCCHLVSMKDEEDWENFDRIEIECSSFEKLLIHAVRARPPLWDSSLSLMERTKKIRDKLWLEIYNLFDEQYTLESLQKKWRNLKDTYTRVTKPECQEKKKPWKHLEALKFLPESIRKIPKKTVRSNLSSPSSAYSTEDESFKVDRKRKLDSLEEAEVQNVSPIALRISQLLDELPNRQRIPIEIKLLQLVYDELYKDE